MANQVTLYIYKRERRRTQAKGIIRTRDKNAKEANESGGGPE